MTGAVRMGAARTAAAGRAIRAGANASTEQQSASIKVESIVISHSVSGNFLVFRLKVNWANAGAILITFTPYPSLFYPKVTQTNREEVGPVRNTQVKGTEHEVLTVLGVGGVGRRVRVFRTD